MTTYKNIAKEIFEKVNYKYRDEDVEIARQVLIREWSDQSVEKLLFVEDGSVDVEKLRKTLKRRAPEIEIVVYRQGSAMPIVRDL